MYVIRILIFSNLLVNIKKQSDIQILLIVKYKVIFTIFVTSKFCKFKVKFIHYIYKKKSNEKKILLKIIYYI